MADTITTLNTWRSNVAKNQPKDGEKINPASPNTNAGQYASLGNAIRDIKGAIREESLNLAWDPSSSWGNNKGTRYVAGVYNTVGSVYYNNTLLLSTWYGKWMRGVEGQQFVLSVGQESTSSVAAQNYNYYTGFVSATRAAYSADNSTASGSYVYVTGLRKWQAATSVNSIGLVSEAVDDISQADYAKIGHGSLGSYVDVFLDFSAYAPMQNLAYAASNFRLQAVTDPPTSTDSNPNSVQECPIPRTAQYGRIRAAKSDSEFCAIFPYPEVDTNYSIDITPQSSTGTAQTASSYIVKKVVKSKSFCVIQFENFTSSGSTIEFDWEIRRNY